jgi:hypothetical protein
VAEEGTSTRRTRVVESSPAAPEFDGGARVDDTGTEVNQMAKYAGSFETKREEKSDRHSGEQGDHADSPDTRDN